MIYELKCYCLVKTSIMVIQKSNYNCEFELSYINLFYTLD